MKCSEDSTYYEPLSPRELPRYEIEEQLRFYRNELDKKDELIRELTKLTATNVVQPSLRYIEASGRSTEKLEQIRTQVEKLQQTITENKEVIREKNTTICDLRAENEKLRVDNLCNIQKIDELEQKIEEQLERINQYHAAKEQHDVILETIQQDVKLKNNKLLHLMSQLRSSETKFEEGLATKELHLDALQNGINDIAKVLDCESTPEQCILKVTELVREVCSCQTQLAQQTDAIQTFEFEQRASRETIMRLSGELNKEQDEKLAAKEEASRAKESFMKVLSTHKQCEPQIRLLESRIKELTDTLHAARTEAKEKEKKFALLNDAEGRLQSKQSSSASSTRKSDDTTGSTTKTEDTEAFKVFLKSLMELFKIPEGGDPPTVLSSTWNRIQNLTEDIRRYSAQIEELQADARRRSQQNATARENEHLLKQRIESLEIQRASDGTVIEGLRAERNQLQDLICKFALAMKFEEPIAEAEMDIVGETLLARATQLQQGDTEKQTKQRIQITRLQRELRESKEHAEALELQVSILRRRLAEAQEHRFQTTIPASQTPMTLAASEKERHRLVKQLKQTKEDADKLREEIVVLKARLLESSQAKLSQVEQSKALKVTQLRVNEVSRTCEEQKQEAHKVRTELEQWKKRYDTEVKKLQTRLEESTKELNKTKEALEISHNSTEQLINFRSMVARHLGLDYEHLSVPDYEILVQLNRLISSNHTNANRIMATEHALNLVDGPYREIRGTLG